MSLPPGFDGVYRCTRHPDREVVAPIACRRCQECHDLALLNYGEHMMREDQWKRLHGDPANEGSTPWGEDIGEGRKRVKKRVERLI